MNDTGSRRDVDVLVVGGGPAGLSTAQRAARGGASVLVLERNPQIGLPVRTSGGSVIPRLRELGLPDDLWHPVSKVAFLGPTVTTAVDLGRDHLCLLDVTRTYRWLAEQARQAGAQVRTGCGVRAPLLDGTAVIGVRTSAGDEITARVVVDATGRWGKLTGAVGVEPVPRRALGLEAVIEAPPGADPAEICLTVGAPATYGWSGPERSGRVRVGLGVIRPDSAVDLRAGLPGVTAALCRYWGTDPGAVVVTGEQHAGVYPVRRPGTVPMVGRGLVVVGDAAGCGSNLLGEGIRYAVISGRLAGGVLAPVLRGERPWSSLGDYPRVWGRRVGRPLRIAHELNVRISRFTPDRWDDTLRRARRLSPDAVARAMASELDGRLVAEVLRSAGPGSVRGLVAAMLPGRRAAGGDTAGPEAPAGATA